MPHGRGSLRVSVVTGVVIVSSSRGAATVVVPVPVPVVHEDVNQGARQQQQVRQRPEQMRAMLLPQEKQRNRAKE
jgi:hypothetical protein